ncbi:hypothetical protein FA15DRAFT_620875 [Coprinopsis marcescibilis]|uniref:Cep57 centrosome microtubule-binding domain-containing protein n=1 Tax=Coprinopsis marcescibilis TaxID=230819 RepID=A0A5C3KS67_COPMA|nr:hypothetical protein FA15DRAFT_620875 [Coprinopsis marcescibilis]
MKRHTKGSAFDISIHNDEQEHTRRQLEQTLKSNITAIPLPPPSDDDDSRHFRHHNHSSVEYPRHAGEPGHFPDFPSFAHRSGEFVEADSQMHGWSYRTGDDDEGINPYGGETMSTAAHHASALTITAGLGGRGARRDVSMSGAEYDPDRPLNQIMAGVGKLSMFDDPSKSKHNASSFEPLVVDSTAELDRILESGFAQPHQISISRSVHPTPPTSASGSDSDPGSPSRSKLSDHLRNVAFSPKRPRTTQMHRLNASPAHQQQTQYPHLGSPLPKKKSQQQHQPNGTMDFSLTNMTPRPTRRVVSSHVSKTPVSQAQQPEVRLQPPTPSTASSKFTRMARGIAKEIEQNQIQDANAAAAAQTRPSSAPTQTTARRISHESPARERRKGGLVNKVDQSKSRIHLPDVTGLTMAVESPAKLGKEYYPYRANGAPRESEVQLLHTLSTVQNKLQQLNEENSVSRRRVRELEMELDECKRDVARERTRLLEREEVIVQQQTDLNTVRSSGSKGKARVTAANVSLNMQDQEEMTRRYKDAVEEKKALEALINSLRTHLTRLTSELASHQQLLVELRDLRDSDSRTLREKGIEIDKLNDEVERLAGEIEVLRGVVEEGLKERRASKEQVSQIIDQADLGMSRDEADDEEEETAQFTDEEEEGRGDVTSRASTPSLSFEATTVTTEESRAPLVAADKTIRTDHATVGSLGSSRFAPGNLTSTPHRVQFIDRREMEQIEAEVEERRSNRDEASDSFSPNMAVPLASSTNQRPRQQRRERPRDETVDDSMYVPDEPKRQRHDRSYFTVDEEEDGRPRTPPPRPHAPEPASAHAIRTLPDQQPPPQQSRAQQMRRPPPQQTAAVPETPFPQIRGERLERLFFSAPEHNPKTCTVCYRRRHREDPRRSFGWSAGAAHGPKRRETDSDEDEGFAEGPDGHDGMFAGGARRGGCEGGSKGKAREQGQVSTDPNAYRNAAGKTGAPPQTVVMRVVRDLEDDFTHYKSVYVELADGYKEMDAASDVPRRNMLAKHLREVVDILEQKGDQIASLYELLSFKDKPMGDSAVPSTRAFV